MVNVKKFLPTFMGPMKDLLNAIIEGDFKEYCKLKIDRMIGAATLNVTIRAWSQPLSSW